MNDSLAPQALVLWLDPQVIRVNGSYRRAECGLVQEWSTNLGQGEGHLERGACREGTNGTSVCHKNTDFVLNLIE